MAATPEAVRRYENALCSGIAVAHYHDALLKEGIRPELVEQYTQAYARGGCQRAAQAAADFEAGLRARRQEMANQAGQGQHLYQPHPEPDYPLWADYRMVFPKRDNSGQRIRPDVLAEYPRAMGRRFGGVTVYPTVLGCYVSQETGDFQCEENVVAVSTARERFPSESQQNEEFIENLGRRAAVDLGQEAIFEVETRDEDAHFIGGVRTQRLPPSYVSTDVFAESLYR